MNKLCSFLLKQTDALIYGFIGPFAMLYVFPQFFLGLQAKTGLHFTTSRLQDTIGSALMWLGGVLALWCAVLMHLHSKDSPVPFSRPKQILQKGPYHIVRHPMMWAITIVLTGEVIAWNSPFIGIWLLIWLRFSAIYIARYEEPYLRSVFGKEYRRYSKKTPRWLPFTRTSSKQRI